MSTRQHSEPMVLRMAHAIAEYIGFGKDEPNPTPAIDQDKRTPKAQSTPRPRLSVVPSPVQREDPAIGRRRRHPQLRQYRPAISDDVRSARHEAVRGLCAARAGATDVALNHFSIAAGCDQVDLTAVPGFWKLTRGQMQTAVDAYEQVGRYKDAAALDAQIASIFRPSLVGSKLRPITPRPKRSEIANT